MLASLVPAECPEETDFFEQLDLHFYACVRGEKEPRLGDPGTGGGVLRVGDCIGAGIVFNPEVPCTASGKVYAKVTLGAESGRDCPPSTVEVLAFTSGSRPVACLDQGPGVLRAGDCTTMFPPAKAPRERGRLSAADDRPVP